MNRPLLRAVAIALLGSMASLTPCHAVDEQATTIYRDEFGIPHIFAPTLDDASYAAGYAQAEDRLEELLKNYRRANGTMAEVFGPSFFADDLRQRLMRHAEVSKARYNQLSPRLRSGIESYKRGIKQFMKDHPEQVPSWAQPIEPWDVVALARYIIWNWPMGEALADLKAAGVEFRPLPYRGSNEMLIAPKRTSMNAADRDHRSARAMVRRHAVLRSAGLLPRAQRRGRFDSGCSVSHPGPQSLLLGRHDHGRP